MNHPTLKRLARISYAAGFTQCCYLANRGTSRVIVFHNVIPDRMFDDALHLDVSLRETIFKRQVDHILKRFTPGVALEAKGGVVFTFDDGYANQFEIGLEYLAEKGVRAYCFCSLDLLENSQPSSVDALQGWLSYAPSGRYTFATLDGHEQCLDLERDLLSRRAAWQSLAEQERSGKVTLAGVLNDVTGSISLERIVSNIMPEYLRLRFLAPTVDQIQRAKRAGHLVGAHSVYHDHLSHLSITALREDIGRCAGEMNTLFNTGVFAYPFGTEEAVSEQVMSEVREAGFVASVSCINGILSNERRYHRYFIPRMMLPQTDDLYVLDFFLSGAFSALKCGSLLPKW